jgi:hypothetical protein
MTNLPLDDFLPLLSNQEEESFGEFLNFLSDHWDESAPLPPPSFTPTDTLPLIHTLGIDPLMDSFSDGLYAYHTSGLSDYTQDAIKSTIDPTFIHLPQIQETQQQTQLVLERAKQLITLDQTLRDVQLKHDSARTKHRPKPYDIKRTNVDGDLPKIGRPRKPPHELLSEQEKRENHLASEQKRRQGIRYRFEELATLIPTLNKACKSESFILDHTVAYIRYLESRRAELRERINQLRM